MSRDRKEREIDKFVGSLDIRDMEGKRVSASKKREIREEAKDFLMENRNYSDFAGLKERLRAFLAKVDVEDTRLHERFDALKLATGATAEAVDAKADLYKDIVTSWTEVNADRDPATMSVPYDDTFPASFWGRESLRRRSGSAVRSVSGGIPTFEGVRRQNGPESIYLVKRGDDYIFAAIGEGDCMDIAREFAKKHNVSVLVDEGVFTTLMVHPNGETSKTEGEGRFGDHAMVVKRVDGSWKKGPVLARPVATTASTSSLTDGLACDDHGNVVVLDPVKAAASKVERTAETGRFKFRVKDWTGKTVADIATKLREIKPDLKLGKARSDVSKLAQLLLVTAGVMDPTRPNGKAAVDGYFGSESNASVSALRSQLGLPAGGLDQALIDALIAAPVASTKATDVPVRSGNDTQGGSAAAASEGERPAGKLAKPGQKDTPAADGTATTGGGATDKPADGTTVTGGGATDKPADGTTVTSGGATDKPADGTTVTGGGATDKPADGTTVTGGGATDKPADGTTVTGGGATDKPADGTTVTGGGATDKPGTPDATIHNESPDSYNAATERARQILVDTAGLNTVPSEDRRAAIIAEIDTLIAALDAYSKTATISEPLRTQAAELKAELEKTRAAVSKLPVKPALPLETQEERLSRLLASLSNPRVVMKNGMPLLIGEDGAGKIVEHPLAESLRKALELRINSGKGIETPLDDANVADKFENIVAIYEALNPATASTRVQELSAQVVYADSVTDAHAKLNAALDAMKSSDVALFTRLKTDAPTDAERESRRIALFQLLRRKDHSYVEHMLVAQEFAKTDKDAQAMYLSLTGGGGSAALASMGINQDRIDEFKKYEAQTSKAWDASKATVTQSVRTEFETLITQYKATPSPLAPEVRAALEAKFGGAEHIALPVGDSAKDVKFNALVTESVGKSEKAFKESYAVLGLQRAIVLTALDAKDDKKQPMSESEGLLANIAGVGFWTLSDDTVDRSLEIGKMIATEAAITGVGIALSVAVPGVGVALVARGIAGIGRIGRVAAVTARMGSAINSSARLARVASVGASVGRGLRWAAISAAEGSVLTTAMDYGHSLAYGSEFKGLFSQTGAQGVFTYMIGKGVFGLVSSPFVKGITLPGGKQLVAPRNWNPVAANAWDSALKATIKFGARALVSGNALFAGNKIFESMAFEEGAEFTIEEYIQAMVMGLAIGGAMQVAPKLIARIVNGKVQVAPVTPPAAPPAPAVPRPRVNIKRPNLPAPGASAAPGAAGATPPAPGATPPAPGATPPAPGATPPAPAAPRPRLKIALPAQKAPVAPAPGTGPTPPPAPGTGPTPPPAPGTGPTPPPAPGTGPTPPPGPGTPPPFPGKAPAPAKAPAAPTQAPLNITVNARYVVRADKAAVIDQAKTGTTFTVKGVGTFEKIGTNSWQRTDMAGNKSGMTDSALKSDAVVTGGKHMVITKV